MNRAPPKTFPPSFFLAGEGNPMREKGAKLTNRFGNQLAEAAWAAACPAWAAVEAYPAWAAGNRAFDFR